MKKVLLLLPANSSFSNPLISAFQDLGWEVKMFDYRKGDMPIRILRFLPIFGGFSKAKNRLNEKIFNINNQFRPDIILTVKGESLDEQLIKKIKGKNNKIINWFPDPMNLWDLMVKIAPYYDFFLHFDPYIVRKLEKIGYRNVKYLPFASDIQEKVDFKKEYDISFVGTYSKYREKLLSALTEFNLNIWGDPRWFKSSLKPFIRGGRIHQNKMKSIIKKSKINLNIHYNAPREGANLRTFEVTGSGGFLLSDYLKDLDKLFKIGDEMTCYKAVKDLQSKASFYLKNEELREKIAQKGYKRAKNYHNYKKRTKQLLELINE